MSHRDTFAPFIGDSGSGGTSGSVPAPNAGDAAAGKFLKADGTFQIPGAGNPGGSSGAVQFNNSGALGGDGTFSWDNTAKQLNMAGSGLFISGAGTLNNAQQALVNLYPPDQNSWGVFVGNATAGPSPGIGLYVADNGEGQLANADVSAALIFYPMSTGGHPVNSVGFTIVGADMWCDCDFTPAITLTNGVGVNVGNSTFIWKQVWAGDGYFTNSVNTGTPPAYANSAYRFYGSELTSATNNYFLWYDSPGVFRVKGDGVMGYYNPLFATKYVPGGVNFERVVQQWNANVAEYGPEAGGTGVLRSLRIIGAGLSIPGQTPASAAATGLAGTVTWDASFVYVCTATDTWKRAAIATW